MRNPGVLNIFEKSQLVRHPAAYDVNFSRKNWSFRHLRSPLYLLLVFLLLRSSFFFICDRTDSDASTSTKLPFSSTLKINLIIKYNLCSLNTKIKKVHLLNYGLCSWFVLLNNISIRIVYSINTETRHKKLNINLKKKSNIFIKIYDYLNLCLTWSILDFGFELLTDNFSSSFFSFLNNIPFIVVNCSLNSKFHEVIKLLKNIQPLKFKKAGRMRCGGARETRWATCHNRLTPSGTKDFLQSPCFLRS